MKQVESIYLLRQCGTLTVQAPHSGKHFEKKSLGSEAAVRRFTSKQVLLKISRYSQEDTSGGCFCRLKKIDLQSCSCSLNEQYQTRKQQEGRRENLFFFFLLELYDFIILNTPNPSPRPPPSPELCCFRFRVSLPCPSKFLIEPLNIATFTLALLRREVPFSQKKMLAICEIVFLYVLKYLTFYSKMFCKKKSDLLLIKSQCPASKITL